MAFIEPKSQGVVSTMREFNCPGEFGNLEELFINEEIAIEAVEDFCKKIVLNVLNKTPKERR